jgi:hypothetical protein
MNAEVVVATTTVTVGKEGGPIKASAKLEAVANSESRKIGQNKREEVKNLYNIGSSYVPPQPSAPIRVTGKLI